MRATMSMSIFVTVTILVGASLLSSRTSFGDATHNLQSSGTPFHSDSLSRLNHQKYKPLLVTIYYEALCGDCITFFNEQFTPHWESFGDSVQWHLVPYGKATHRRGKNGEWHFTCQHNRTECESNAIESSILHIADQRTAIHFISCYMQAKEKHNLGPKCAALYNVDFKYLQDISDSTVGRNWLAAFGDETLSVRPEITFIPTITFNNIHCPTSSEEAFKDLRSAIENRLPRNVELDIMQLHTSAHVPYTFT